MNLIDINVMLDHPVYSKDSTAGAIMATLNSDGVTAAVVSSLRPLASLDFDAGNKAAADFIKKYPKKLFGFAIVNPIKVKQLENALSYLPFKGVRLSPNFMWIEYSDAVLPLVELAVKNKMAIHVSVTPERPSNMKMCAEIAESFHQANVIMGQIWTPYTWNEAIVLSRNYDNLYLEVGFATTRSIEDAVEVAGPSKLIFGSGMPNMKPRAAVGIVNS
ncbi:MAG: amidohydrolase family protein, partial [Nitrososphaerales archaeon]